MKGDIYLFSKKISFGICIQNENTLHALIFSYVEMFLIKQIGKMSCYKKRILLCNWKFRV